MHLVLAVIWLDTLFSKDSFLAILYSNITCTLYYHLFNEGVFSVRGLHATELYFIKMFLPYLWKADRL